MVLGPIPLECQKQMSLYKRTKINPVYFFHMRLEREYVKINAQKYKFAKDYHICLNIRWAFSQKISPQKGVSHLLFDASQTLSWCRKHVLSHFLYFEQQCSVC